MLDFICTLVGGLKDALRRMRSTAFICLEKLSFLQNKDQQSFTSVLEKSLLWAPLGSRISAKRFKAFNPDAMVKVILILQ